MQFFSDVMLVIELLLYTLGKVADEAERGSDFVSVVGALSQKKTY